MDLWVLLFLIAIIVCSILDIPFHSIGRVQFVGKTCRVGRDLLSESQIPVLNETLLEIMSALSKEGEKLLLVDIEKQNELLTRLNELMLQSRLDFLRFGLQSIPVGPGERAQHGERNSSTGKSTGKDGCNENDIHNSSIPFEPSHHSTPKKEPRQMHQSIPTSSRLSDKNNSNIHKKDDQSKNSKMMTMTLSDASAHANSSCSYSARPFISWFECEQCQKWSAIMRPKNKDSSFDKSGSTIAEFKYRRYTESNDGNQDSVPRSTLSKTGHTNTDKSAKSQSGSSRRDLGVSATMTTNTVVEEPSLNRKAKLQTRKILSHLTQKYESFTQYEIEKELSRLLKINGISKSAAERATRNDDQSSMLSPDENPAEPTGKLCHEEKGTMKSGLNELNSGLFSFETGGDEHRRHSSHVNFCYNSDSSSPLQYSYESKKSSRRVSFNENPTVVHLPEGCVSDTPTYVEFLKDRHDDKSSILRQQCQLSSQSHLKHVNNNKQTIGIGDTKTKVEMQPTVTSSPTAMYYDFYNDLLLLPSELMQIKKTVQSLQSQVQQSSEDNGRKPSNNNEISLDKFSSCPASSSLTSQLHGESSQYTKLKNSYLNHLKPFIVHTRRTYQHKEAE